MKFCNQCGAQLEDDMLFCNMCGAKQEAAPAAPEAAPAPEVEAPAEEANDDELIAVIAAAVATFCAQSGTQDVRIKSVRRVSSWKNVARSEQILKL